MTAREPAARRARVRRVTRVPADEVPDAYPLDAAASHALELVVERERGDEEPRADGTGEVVRVYEAWPSGGHTGSRLARLLDAIGEPSGNPGALDGEHVVLESRDSSPRVDVDATRALHQRAAPASVDTHSLAEIAIVAGMLAGLLVFPLAQAAGRAAVAPAALAVVALPLSLGYDAWRTRDATWSPRPLPWAAGGVVPVLNVAVAAAYLVRKSVVIDDPEDAEDVWRDLLAGAVVAFAAGLALAAFDLTFPVGATVFVHAWALAPVAVYLDGRSARHGDSPPNRAPWVAAAVVLGGASGLVYLLRTDGIELQ